MKFCVYCGENLIGDEGICPYCGLAVPGRVGKPAHKKPEPVATGKSSQKVPGILERPSMTEMQEGNAEAETPKKKGCGGCCSATVFKWYILISIIGFVAFRVMSCAGVI